jgi:hypothetical protein
VCANGADSVMACEGRVGFRLGELLQAGVGAVDHGDCDDAVDSDHRSGRDGVGQLV